MIQLRGHVYFIKIGEVVSVKAALRICCGNHAFVSIGKRTSIVEVHIFAAEGSIRVGDDCLFSYQIVLRNNDSHHLFVKASGKRINYAGNMEIGNHVWVGYGMTLLGCDYW